MKRELLECLNMMKRIGAMNECVYDRILLNEGADVNSRNAAIKLYMEKTDCKNPEYAKLFVNDTLRIIVTSLRDRKCAKFICGVARLYLDGQFDANDNITINKLNTILYFLAHKNIAIDSNLGKMSLQQLFDKFYNDAVASQENSNIQTQDTSNGGYTIVPIPDFETASEYWKYVNWCITDESDYYDRYTSDGLGMFYFCLRNDFKDFDILEPEEAGENAPLDDYGLSMLAVCVDVEGNYKSCTCRWNHDVEGANDYVLNVDQISDLIGRNFYDVFKPRFTPEELEQKKTEIIRRDASGVEGIDIIKNILGQFNFINEQGELLSPKRWFSYCGYFCKGFAKVSFRGKWNLIKPNGHLLSPDVWFDGVNSFYDGFAEVWVNGKGNNYINQDGKLLSNYWFDSTIPFRNGFAKVTLRGEDGKIDTKGNFYPQES